MNRFPELEIGDGLIRRRHPFGPNTVIGADVELASIGGYIPFEHGWLAATPITQIRIENYKALRDVTVDLTPIHVLIGPNDSGKTSILEAVNALCRSVDHPLTQAFTGSWFDQQLVTRGSTNAPVILAAQIKDAAGEFSYCLATQFTGVLGQRVALSASELVTEGDRVTRFSDRRGSDASSVLMVSSGQWGGTNEELSAARRVRVALAGAQYYRWDPRQLALPVAPDASRRFKMDPSGFGLALCLDDILGFDRQQFSQMEDRFRKIFPAVKSIKLIPEKAYRAPIDESRGVPMLQPSDGKGIYFQLAAGGGLVPASQSSDSALLVLAYLTVLTLPQPPHVLLVEEPENGIHPKRLQEVLNVLRDLVQGQNTTQVLLTTHSPYVLDLFAPQEVTLCRKSEGGDVSVHRLSDSRSVREQLDVFSLGEIWTAEGDDKIAATAAIGGISK